MRLRIRCQPCGYTCTNPLFSLLSSSALASCIALTCSLNSILTVLPPSFLSLIRKVWCIREMSKYRREIPKKGHICPVGPDIQGVWSTGHKLCPVAPI